MQPTDWFRIRHPQPFSEDAFEIFRASCHVYRAKVEAILEKWQALPTVSDVPKPQVSFFAPERSPDGRIMSLPLRVEGQTLGSRSLLHTLAAKELHVYLPFPLVAEIEVGLTEPSFENPAEWRHDWWDPHKPTGIPGEEALRLLGVRVRIPLFRRLKLWVCGKVRQWCE